MQNHKGENAQANQFRVLRQFLQIAGSKKLIEPGGLLEGRPVTLRHLEFPTVEHCTILGIGDVEAKQLVGQKRFDEVSFREVDFSYSKLDFAVWSKCFFRRVIFDRASLQACIFFGCEFADCSFKNTNCSNTSFGVESDGTECLFKGCCFQNVRFSGASWCKPTFIDSSFDNCRINKCEFDGGMFKSTRFVGRYEELSFKGEPGAKDRNRLDIDLTQAEVTWLHANHGIDLSALHLSPNGSNLVIRNRKNAIPAVLERLIEYPEARTLAYMLENMYTDKSISPLSSSQETIFLSSKLLAELDEALSEDQALLMLQKIRGIALELGFTA